MIAAWRMAALAATVGLAMPLSAQMTVSGRVTADNRPVRDASVSIGDLALGARTNSEGQYSFLIRASQVRGQSVTIVARHSRFGSQSAQIVLTGGSVVQDFVLSRFAPRPGVTTAVSTTPAHQELASRTIDSTAFIGLTGPIDVAAALVGQFPGLTVTTGSAGGSSPMVYRGPRSLLGTVQPLVIVDGVALDHSSVTTAAQRFGLGGFDYGSRLQDIALDDVATVRMLHGASAVSLYGLRAANGVVVVTTKAGGSGRGTDPVINVRYSGESAIGLPSFQNRYGQGLSGQFEFFDGRGGGINDDVAESWGPALNGQPMAQASVTEPGRPDVRYWLPHPGGTESYFGYGQTIDANIALNGTRQWASGRVALNARGVSGVTPNASSHRLGLTFSGSAQPTSRLSGRANVQFIDAGAENRPGTGFDEVNAVAGFTRTPRQVDIDALRSPLAIGTEQINWIYTTRNNPFFQTVRNSNDDARTHVRMGGVLRYDSWRGITATLTAGLEDSDESRDIDVAAGWNGSYPTALGRRDFSGGGSQRQTLSMGERSVGLLLSSAPQRRYGLDLSASTGIEQRRNRFRESATVTDTSSVSASDTSTTDVTSFHLAGVVSRRNTLFLNGGVRIERASFFPTTLGAASFPSLSVMYDALGGVGALGRDLRLGVARLRASWWEAGNELAPRMLRQAYVGGGTDTAPTLGFSSDSVALPERTRGIEVTTELAMANGRLGLDVTAYQERSREVLLSAGQSAVLTNRGYEAQLRAAPVGDTALADGVSWSLGVSFNRNSNRVDRLGPGVDVVQLSPFLSGAALAARRGEPLGVILGSRYLRDSSTQQLLLANGLPITDAATAKLGHIQPDWTASVRNRLRLGAIELSFLVDARAGGNVFSAINRWGSHAGTLESTLTGRETGLVIAGLDTLTRTANQDTVSAEAYFHALADIHEAWVYDASFWKLREARITYSLPLRMVPGFREHLVKAALVGRNLMTWAKAPNIDPETALSTGVFQGFEMGQLPQTRSIGLHISIAP